MAVFQLMAYRQKMEIGGIVGARIQSDEPGGAARFYNSGVSGRLYITESSGEPPPEITGLPILPTLYWPEYWQPSPLLQLWAWASVES